MATSRKTKTESPETNEPAGNSAQRIRLKLAGVGGAGRNVVAHLAELRAAGNTGLAGIELLAINTDSQSLNDIPDTQMMQIGAAVTHGLGAGGDVELGLRAAQNDTKKLEAAMQGAAVVFITTGLGGGTGTGASPIVARVAREQGALVLAFVMLPFGFEGDRRRQLALAGLDQLKSHADAVICIPNDKLMKLAGEQATAVEAFQRGHEVIGSGVQAIWQLLSRRGLVNLDFADLRTTLGQKHCEGIFSHGEAIGADRAKEAVRLLFENPILEGGDVLARAEGVIVSILGGPDLTLTEVQKIVEPISKAASRSHVIMGAAIDDNYREKISVTVIAAVPSLRRIVPGATGRFVPNTRPGLSRAVPGMTAPIPASPTPATPVAEPAPAAAASVTKKEPKAKQETLPLEGVSKGRFDRSEPTLYDGEDLDVPTFLRRGISLKK